MRITFVIHTLDPAAGGVTSAVSELALSMASLGHTCRIISFDPPHRVRPAIEGVECVAIGPAKGSYGYIASLEKKLRVQSTDLLVLNGLWLHSTFGVANWARKNKIPYVLYPHGMLDPYFSRFFFKHAKKLLYWLLFERHTIRHAKAICYTTGSEKALAQKTFPLFFPQRQEVVGLGLESAPVATDTAKENFYSHFPQLRDTPFLLHMGRFHPKKGCDLLLKALHDFPSTKLAMVGPLHGAESAFIEKLRDLAPADRVIWTGLLTGELKWGALCAARALILPSHQENFGMIVAEALSVGTPVLISDKVALSEEVTRHKCGFVEPDTFEGTRSLLRRYVRLGQEELPALRQNALECYRANFMPKTVAERFNKLAHELVGTPLSK